MRRVLNLQIVSWYTRDAPKIKTLGCFHPRVSIFDPFVFARQSNYISINDQSTSRNIFILLYWDTHHKLIKCRPKTFRDLYLFLDWWNRKKSHRAESGKKGVWLDCKLFRVQILCHNACLKLCSGALSNKSWRYFIPVLGD